MDWCFLEPDHMTYAYQTKQYPEDITFGVSALAIDCIFFNMKLTVRRIVP